MLPRIATVVASCYCWIETDDGRSQMDYDACDLYDVLNELT